MEKLTPRQTKILEFIREYHRVEKNAPTYREISDHFGFKSPKAAVDHVTALEKKGCLRRRGGRSRGIEIISSDRKPDSDTIFVPLLGDIPAGHPEVRMELQQGLLAVDKALLGRSAGHRLFSLQVHGSSMTGRGIHEGDWAVADADAVPREGDVVVALVDGENTLKTLAGEKGACFLKAGNPAFPDVIPCEEMTVQGVVKVILRRMS